MSKFIFFFIQKDFFFKFVNFNRSLFLFGIFVFENFKNLLIGKGQIGPLKLLIFEIKQSIIKQAPELVCLQLGLFEHFGQWGLIVSHELLLLFEVLQFF